MSSISDKEHTQAWSDLLNVQLYPVTFLEIVMMETYNMLKQLVVCKAAARWNIAVAACIQLIASDELSYTSRKKP